MATVKSLLPKLDKSSKPKMYPYALHWTAVTDYCEDFEAKLIDWHRRKCDSAVICREGGPGHDEHLHYHSIGTFKTKQQAGVRRMCETFYKKIVMEWGPNAVVVREAKVLAGAMWYIFKDKPIEDVYHYHGWRMTWMQELIAKNLKKMPHCQLLKDQYILTPKTARNMIIAYAKARNIMLCGRDTFRDCLKTMSREGYSVVAVWPKITVVYAEVMLQMGNETAFDELFETAFIGFS